MIPTKKTKKKTDLRDFTILLYGLQKIGKSTTCARIDGALFIPTEPGHNSLEIFAMPQVRDWKHFLSIANEVSTTGHPYKSIVIDLVDNLYQHCADYICKLSGVSHESDLGYGKGYALIRNEFMRVMTKLAGLPTGLVLVSHSVERESEDRTGKKIVKVMPNLPNCIRTSLIGMVDCELLATIGRDKDGNKTRVIRSVASEAYEAGDRTGLFPDGMLLEDLFSTDATTIPTKGGK